MEIMSFGFIKSVIALVTIGAITVTSWILGLRMRRRIKRTLGIEVNNEMELTSLKTWMDVENARRRIGAGNCIETTLWVNSMYHYDPNTALEELNEDATLPNPVHVRDMILRKRLSADKSLELNRLFVEYQKFFAEAQKLGREILKELAT